MPARPPTAARAGRRGGAPRPGRVGGATPGGASQQLVEDVEARPPVRRVRQAVVELGGVRPEELVEVDDAAGEGAGGQTEDGAGTHGCDLDGQPVLVAIV